LPDFGAGATVAALSSAPRGTTDGFNSFRAVNLAGIGVFRFTVLAGVRLLADLMTLDAIGDDESTSGGVSSLAIRSTGVLSMTFSCGVCTFELFSGAISTAASGFGGEFCFGTSFGVFNGSFSTTTLDEAGVFGFGLTADLEPAEADFGVSFLSTAASFGTRF